VAISDSSRIGIEAPHLFNDGVVDTDLVKRFVQRAEAAGYSSLWTQERTTGSPTVLHPIPFLGYIAGMTERARIGVTVFVLPRHSAFHMAKYIADLDQLSGGRLVVGVGLGTGTGDLPRYGIPEERRVTRFVEQVEAMKALWTQSPASYSGELVSFENAEISPKPAQKPYPPLWFGANSDSAVRRSVRMADGFTGSGTGARDRFAGLLSYAKEQLAEQGREPSSFTISKRFYVAVDEDEARAERRLREWYGWYYGNPDIANRSAIWGGRGRIEEQLAAWSEAGVDEFILNPVFDLEEHLESLAEITGLQGGV
jgi:probable F420-dependent oxidoreductase